MRSQARCSAAGLCLRHVVQGVPQNQQPQCSADSQALRCLVLVVMDGVIAVTVDQVVWHATEQGCTGRSHIQATEIWHRAAWTDPVLWHRIARCPVLGIPIVL